MPQTIGSDLAVVNVNDIDVRLQSNKSIKAVGDF